MKHKYLNRIRKKINIMNTNQRKYLTAITNELGNKQTNDIYDI